MIFFKTHCPEEDHWDMITKWKEQVFLMFKGHFPIVYIKRTELSSASFSLPYKKGIHNSESRLWLPVSFLPIICLFFWFWYHWTTPPQPPPPPPPMPRPLNQLLSVQPLISVARHAQPHCPTLLFSPHRWGEGDWLCLSGPLPTSLWLPVCLWLVQHHRFQWRLPGADKSCCLPSGKFDAL